MKYQVMIRMKGIFGGKEKGSMLVTTRNFKAY